jgi:HlyD family secretion protein
VSRTRICAPVAGTILRRNFETGEVVAVGSPIATLLDLSELWVELSVDESVHGQLSLGQPAEIEVEGTGDRYHGKVTFLADRYGFTPRNVQTQTERARLAYRVKVTVTPPCPGLKPGMFARVTAGHGPR